MIPSLVVHVGDSVDVEDALGISLFVVFATATAIFLSVLVAIVAAAVHGWDELPNSPENMMLLMIWCCVESTLAGYDTWVMCWVDVIITGGYLIFTIYIGACNSKFIIIWGEEYDNVYIYISGAPPSPLHLFHYVVNSKRGRRVICASLASMYLLTIAREASKMF